MIIHKNYNELFNLDNILYSWKKFRLGKTKKYDVMSFERHLEDNIFSLFDDLQKNSYLHSEYIFFQVFDNKKRDIYKAEVRDRLVHQIIYDYLTGIYEDNFITDSYSSRIGKGTHNAIKTFVYFSKLIGNKNFFVLKCDIKKYFQSINKKVLASILKSEVKDENIFNIIEKIIYSFKKDEEGIPLGNVTSQIFANIYLNELDKFVKKELKVRFYVRYNDDFLILDSSEERLKQHLSKIRIFLETELHLEVPDNKASIRKIEWGIDFLGHIILPNCVLLRNSTKNKIFQKLSYKNIDSKFGILKHCNSYNLRQKLKSFCYSKLNLI